MEVSNKSKLCHVKASCKRSATAEEERPSLKRVIAETDQWIFTDQELEAHYQPRHVNLLSRPLTSLTPRETTIRQLLQSHIYQKLASYRYQDKISRRGGDQETVSLENVGVVGPNMTAIRHYPLVPTPCIIPRHVLHREPFSPKTPPPHDHEEGPLSHRSLTLNHVLEMFEHHKHLDASGSSVFACFYCRQPVHVLYSHVRDPRQWTVERIDNRWGHCPGNVVLACLSCNLRRRTMYHERYRATKQMVTVIKNEGDSIHVATAAPSNAQEG